MIEIVSNNATTLVVAVILITIIEMILPSGNNKKYIKFFGGIILVIITLTPLINVLNTDINITNFINDNQIEVSNMEYEISEDYIYESYIDNLEKDIIKRLEENGYEVIDIDLIIEKETYTPSEIELEVKHPDGEIQPVIIEVFGKNHSQLSSHDKEIIKTLINMNYGIKMSKIVINK